MPKQISYGTAIDWIAFEYRDQTDIPDVACRLLATLCDKDIAAVHADILKKIMYFRVSALHHQIVDQENISLLDGRSYNEAGRRAKAEASRELNFV